MENLEIISTQVTVQAKQVVNGNTVNFAWNYMQSNIPQVVNFNVQRGIENGEPFTGNNIISGAFYTQTEKFDVNNNNYQEGDFNLYQSILITCKSIVADLQQEE